MIQKNSHRLQSGQVSKLRAVGFPQTSNKNNFVHVGKISKSDISGYSLQVCNLEE